ncbi:MAG: hypothetical protein GY828_06650 [Candidatus Gracilibacteria bacterium]|nr:hypothetical protein [Candidatus Gracilibacteria bacterium]
MLFPTSNNTDDVSGNKSDISHHLYSEILPLCKDLGISFADLMYLQTKLSWLQKTGKFCKPYTFSDLDDTLLSRLPQLGKDVFAKNRAIEGNKVVYSQGLSNYTQNYYSPDLVVHEIMRETDIILSAGDPVIQYNKMNASGLGEFDAIITKSHSDKPRDILYHILFTLESIPRKVIINDDRITELLPRLSRISHFLGIPFECNNITLDINQYNTVGSIKQSIISHIDYIT